MTRLKTTYTERAFRAALGRKLLSVVVGRISADAVERWLDVVSVDNAPLTVSRRVALMSALHIVMASLRKPGDGERRTSNVEHRTPK